MCVNRFRPNIISRTRWLVKGFFGFFLLFRGKGGRAGVSGGGTVEIGGAAVGGAVRNGEGGGAFFGGIKQQGAGKGEIVGGSAAFIFAGAKRA